MTVSQARSVSLKGVGVRIAAAAVMVPVVLLDVWLGGLWFELGIAVLAAVIAWEWCAMTHDGDRAQAWLHGLAGVSAALLPNAAGLSITIAVVVACWAVSVALLGTRSSERPFWPLIGIPYIAMPAASLVVLRDGGEWGLVAVVWLLCAVWSADTAAYFAGRLIGGPKLAPAVSPNKTWAGLAGAVLGALAASVVTGYVAGLGGLAVLAVLGAALGLVEQAGDLFESAAKRRFGRKDTGRLIPGHGGVLDRVDGLLFAAVAAALLGAARGGGAEAAAGLMVW